MNLPLRRSFSWIIGFLFIVAINTSHSHHSFAPHFDMNMPVLISGKVTKFEARNPHAYVHIEAENENGLKQVYRCESHGVTMLERSGINREMVAPGQEISVEGFRHRRNPLMCFFNSVELANGTKLNANGSDSASTRLTEVAKSAAENIETRHDIFGTWLLLPARRSTSGFQPMIDFLTALGEEATKKYDPFKDDPTFQCSPVAIRRAWFAPGTPLSLSREGDNIVIHHEWMDAERLVHMNEKEHPTHVPSTTLGYSIGRFKGDTLIIETKNYSEGVLRQYVEQEGLPTRGLLHSDELHTIERISFDTEKQLVNLSIEQTDPKFFSKDFPPAAAQYGATKLQIKPFGCTPEVLD